MVTEATKHARALDRQLFDSTVSSRPLRRDLAAILDGLGQSEHGHPARPQTPQGLSEMSPLR